MAGKKLMKDTFLYATAHFGSGILAFLMLPLYTHYFTTKEYGYWDVMVTTVTLLSPLLTFELVSAVYRWLLVESHTGKKAGIITTGMVNIVRNLIIADFFALLIGWFIAVPYFWLALVYMHATIAVSFLQQCARGLHRNKLFAGMGILQTILTILAILLLMFVWHLRIEAFFYANIFSAICVAIFAWCRLRFHQYIQFYLYSPMLLRTFLVYSLPIIPGAASWWLMTMSDRYFIIGFLGLQANGVYALANKIPAMLLMVNSVFALAWKDQAILAYHDKGKNDYYSIVFRHFFRGMASAFICIAVLAKPVLEAAVSTAFLDAWKYIGVLLPGTVFHAFALFWAAGYHGAKKTSVIFSTSMVGAGVNVLLNLAFIRPFGLYAVAAATTVSFLVTWIIRVRAAGDHFHIKLPKLDMIILFPLMIAATASPFFPDTIPLTLSIPIAAIISLLANWPLLKIIGTNITGILRGRIFHTLK